MGETYDGLALTCICIEGYTRHASSGHCRLCPAGTQKFEPGDQACSACPAGKYGNCTSCPAHTNSVNGSSAVTDCKCNVGYTGPDGGSCVACVAGKFKTSNGTAACAQCVAGKHSSALALGTDACADCGRDTYSNSDSTQCVACPANAVSAALSSVDTDCKCNVGYTGPDGAACAACVVGTYKDVSGSAPCTLCPKGKYAAEIGVSGCSTCPDHANSTPGSMNISNCVCEQGYTGANGTQCTACAHGTYKASSGSEECVRCPQNTFSNISASVQCTACAYGTYRLYSSINATNCSVCPNSTINSTLPPGCPM